MATTSGETLVLAPLDGSDLAEQVIPYAVGLAEGTGGMVHLVTVVSPTQRNATDIAMVGPYTGPIAAAHGAAEESSPQSPVPANWAEDYLRNMVDRLQGEGVRVSFEVRTGETVDEILEAATAQNAALIAIATRGQTGLRRAVFGSVADALLRRSGRPVMVFNPRTPD